VTITAWFKYLHSAHEMSESNLNKWNKYLKYLQQDDMYDRYSHPVREMLHEHKGKVKISEQPE